MYAAGASYTDVAKALNAEGILSPQPPRKGKIRAWCPSAIREMLLNEKYRGVVVWNRTKTVRNRETGKTEQRPRPESEWVRVEVPELRIVSDQLWESAREQNRRVREKHGPKRLGGMNRTVASRQYLFSSLLECGLCNANMVIVGGQPPNAQYGCPNHRYRGVCENSVRIPQRKLEQQLLAALSANLLDLRLEEERVQSFRDQLKATLAAETRRTLEAASQDSQLKEQLAALKKEQENLVDGIAKHGFSPALSARLAAVESRIAQIQRLRDAGVEPKVPEFPTEEIRDFVRRKSQEFANILAGDAATAREQLRKRITKLVLTPKQTHETSSAAASGETITPTARITRSVGSIGRCCSGTAKFFSLLATPLRFAERTRCCGGKSFYIDEEICWFNPSGKSPDWLDPRQKCLACLIRGHDAIDLFLMFNAGSEAVTFAVSPARYPRCWRLAADTAESSPYGFYSPGEEAALAKPASYLVQSRSSVILVER
jgi:hypothetical protein